MKKHLAINIIISAISLYIAALFFEIYYADGFNISHLYSALWRKSILLVFISLALPMHIISYVLLIRAKKADEKEHHEFLLSSKYSKYIMSFYWVAMAIIYEVIV